MAYAELAGSVIEAHGGCFLARGGRVASLEGIRADPRRGHRVPELRGRRRMLQLRRLSGRPRQARWRC